jgi:hypothetical protein
MSACFKDRLFTFGLLVYWSTGLLKKQLNTAIGRDDSGMPFAIPTPLMPYGIRRMHPL